MRVVILLVIAGDHMFFVAGSYHAAGHFVGAGAAGHFWGGVVLVEVDYFQNINLRIAF